MSTLWQPQLIQALRTELELREEVLALILFGSVMDGSTLDSYSDADLLLVVRDEAVADYFPSLAWLEKFGTLYTYEQNANEFFKVSRICFESMQRLDLLIAAESPLKQLDAWPISFWPSCQSLFAKSAEIAAFFERGFPEPTLSVATPAEFEAMVNQFWFQGTIAVYKVVRNDLLIALHLTLEMLQTCCVLRMMLRDLAEGTTHHRSGGTGNQFVSELSSAHQLNCEDGILQLIVESSHHFDKLAVQWSAAYQEKRFPLLKWIEQIQKHKGLE